MDKIEHVCSNCTQCGFLSAFLWLSRGKWHSMHLFYDFYGSIYHPALSNLFGIKALSSRTHISRTLYTVRRFPTFFSWDCPQEILLTDLVLSPKEATGPLVMTGGIPVAPVAPPYCGSPHSVLGFWFPPPSDSPGRLYRPVNQALGRKWWRLESQAWGNVGKQCH